MSGELQRLQPECRVLLQVKTFCRLTTGVFPALFSSGGSVLVHQECLREVKSPSNASSVLIFDVYRLQAFEVGETCVFDQVL